jgi:hypothetical protein
LVLHLPSTDDESRLVPCEVRHCTMVRDGLFLIGVAFSEVSNPASRGSGS